MAQIKHQCEHGILRILLLTQEGFKKLFYSLGRGALEVELLKMYLHPLIGKRPGILAFFQENTPPDWIIISPEGKCALADMSLWIEENLDNISYFSHFLHILVLDACPSLMKRNEYILVIYQMFLQMLKYS